jgi:signal transduction histidine kinase
MSVRAHVVAVMLAIAGPLMAFSAFLVMHAAGREQSLIADQVRAQAQGTATAIDQMIGAETVRLFGLATSATLEDGDLSAFHAYAADLGQREGRTLLLTDPSGRPVLSSAVPFGTPLPALADQAKLRQVVNTGLPAISGLVVAGSGGVRCVLVSVPVIAGGRVRYVLSGDVIGALGKVLVEQHLPASWNAAVIDAEGFVIAHNGHAEGYVGHLARVDAIAHVQQADNGWFPYLSLDGVPMENAFTHIDRPGWAIVIGIPRVALMEPVRESTYELLLLGAGTLGVAAVLAFTFGRQISRPIERLAALAKRVGKGRSIDATDTGLRETDTVAQALAAASQKIAGASAERMQITEDMRLSAARYRALAEELSHAYQERQELLQLTVQSQEDERRRVARELHDGFGQYLTALRMGLTAMEPHCPPDSQAPRQLASLKGLTDELGKAVGRMAWEIRPTALDDLGLENAIRQYLEEWADRSDLRIDQEIHIEGGRLPSAIEITLFRVLQEAITNVVKHSGADHVAVIVDSNATEVRLIVEDNGSGFPEAPEDGTILSRPRQLGLLGMRERLALVHGALEVESQTGQGTTLYVRVPVKAGIG